MFDGQFICSNDAGTDLPTDAQLRSWDGEKLFDWGAANWRWGNGCSELMDFNRRYLDCLNGDTVSCTYINQIRPEMIRKYGTAEAKAAEAQRLSSSSS